MTKNINMFKYAVQQDRHKRTFSVSELYRSFVFVPSVIAKVMGNRKSKLVDDHFKERLLLTATGVNGSAACASLHTKISLKKGMSKMSAIGALMHKILRIIYGMLKNNTEFDPKIDKKNSNKIVIAKINGKQNKERRFLKFNKNAPISRRQSKKRKEQNSSQDEISSNTGSSSDSFQIPSL